MPPVGTDENRDWEDAVKRRQRRIKRHSLMTVPTVFFFALISLIWLFVRLLGCQMDIPLVICEWSFGGPILVLIIIVLIFLKVLYDLMDFGVESAVRQQLSAQQSLSLEQIAKHKSINKRRIKKWRHHSRFGYKQLDMSYQWHVRMMGGITAGLLGIQVGYLFFYYTNFPALMAVAVAVLSAIILWYLALFRINNENGGGTSSDIPP
jgi:hypothetical protein